MRFCLAILTLHCKIARLPSSLGPWPAFRPRRSGSRCASRRRGRRARPGPPGSCRSRSRRWAGGPYPSAALIGPQTTYTHPFGTKLSVPNVLKLSSNPMGDSTDSIGVVFPSPPVMPLGHDGVGPPRFVPFCSNSLNSKFSTGFQTPTSGFKCIASH